MIKATGIVRRIDDLGRVVLPVELRKSFGIHEADPIEILVDNENSTILLKKYQPGCGFCGNMGELVDFSDHKICRECVDKIKTL